MTFNMYVADPRPWIRGANFLTSLIILYIFKKKIIYVCVRETKF